MAPRSARLPNTRPTSIKTTDSRYDRGTTGGQVIGLEPRLGEAWRGWVIEKGGVDPALVDDIERRIVALNAQIAEAFGRQFEIGHSYVTPTAKLEPGATREWFRQVAETEIGPLLDEYWFDAPKSAREALDRLLQGW